MSICVEQVLLENGNAVRVLSSCFAPFAKGGHGGFALRVMPGQEQKQIPLDPPFAKGENKADPTPDVVPRATGMSMQVAA